MPEKQPARLCDDTWVQPGFMPGEIVITHVPEGFGILDSVYIDRQGVAALLEWLGAEVKK